MAPGIHNDHRSYVLWNQVLQSVDEGAGGDMQQLQQQQQALVLAKAKASR